MTIDYSSLPRLKDSMHRLTSCPNSEENCIAHAMGACGEWWWPETGRIWPAGPPYNTEKVENFVYVLERQGFVECDSSYEAGCEKIAVYSKDGKLTHAARQLPKDGTWTSKLGPDDDISHATLESLCDTEDGTGTYGTVFRILKRAVADGKRRECCEEKHAIT